MRFIMFHPGQLSRCVFVYAKLEVQYQQIINNVDTAAETFMTCYGRL